MLLQLSLPYHTPDKYRRSVITISQVHSGRVNALVRRGDVTPISIHHFSLAAMANAPPAQGEV